MKITIENTNDIQMLDGVETRRWNGEVEGGGKCHVFVHRVAVLKGTTDEFKADVELDEKVPPKDWDLIEAVFQMRKCQREFFKTRSRDDLHGAKKWECTVDELLDQARGQKRLAFD